MPYAQSHGHDLYYLTAGVKQAVALVFVHGTGGNAGIWFEQFDHFSKNHFCIAYDHRGFGRSACAPDDFSADFFADDVKAILDAEGITSCVVICSSLGGWTGVKFALKYPEALSALVVCNSTASVDIPEAVEACEQSKPRAEAEGAAAVAFAPSFFTDYPLKAYLFEQIQMATPIDQQLPWEVVYDRIMAPDMLTSPDDVARITCETLHIAGEMDRIFTPDVLKAVASTFGHSRYAEIPGVAHCPWIEDPDAFNNVLSGFLNEVG